ncbi:MAG: hypothetical protein EHM42_09865, partial [Planctomycetaceae bacterium]
DPWTWLIGARIESLVALGVLVAAPFAWLAKTRPETAAYRAPEPLSKPSSLAGEAALSIALGALAIVVCAIAGEQFARLPPAIHDEYSYLFQARTFLAGRVTFDSPPLPELFDQMHVLNEGKMASRYFPATGLWLAPFVALGQPVWGWWLAQGIFTVLVYWIGRELGGRQCAAIAAVLTALCPGLVFFSSLLLSHHPTLLGLGLFLLGMLRTLNRRCRKWALVAGLGLAFAALARPMTAAGAALPWGLFLVWRACRDRRELRFWPALAAPLIMGAGAMLAYDAAITGSAWETPYGLYTKLHTPRHVYGFNNVTRGEQHLGPRVIDNYDRWAENLTPQLAGKNVMNRVLTSAQWTLGILPVVFGLSLGLVMWPRLTAAARLCLASIVSLHLAHVPYWYDGIFHFHYVFETLPLWLLFLAAAGSSAVSGWNAAGRGWISRWCVAGLAAATAVNYTTEQGFWGAPFLDASNQSMFARQKYQSFRNRVASEVKQRPALVLVEPDPSDRHIDYVVNDPPLTGDVLVGRYLPDRYTADEIREFWPDRTVYIYRVRAGTVSRMP